MNLKNTSKNTTKRTKNNNFQTKIEKIQCLTKSENTISKNFKNTKFDRCHLDQN